MRRIPEQKIRELEQTAYQIRTLAIESISACEVGHPGGSLSQADILAALYFDELRIRPSDPNWEDRDRFILSKAHTCHSLYSALALKGFFPKEELFRGGHIKSVLQGHADMKMTPGLDASGGSLGQGLSIAAGMAWAARKMRKDLHVYCLVGDGECEEGQIWEAAMSAAHNKLDNLTCIVDYNKVQAKAWVYDEINLDPLADKWISFGWQTVEIDGHDMEEILQAFYTARWMNRTGRPTVIIAHTVKGRGVPWMEFNPAWHTHAPNEEDKKRALADLETSYGRCGEGRE